MDEYLTVAGENEDVEDFDAPDHPDAALMIEVRSHRVRFNAWPSVGTLWCMSTVMCACGQPRRHPWIGLLIAAGVAVPGRTVLQEPMVAVRQQLSPYGTPSHQMSNSSSGSGQTAVNAHSSDSIVGFEHAQGIRDARTFARTCACAYATPGGMLASAHGCTAAVT